MTNEDLTILFREKTDNGSVRTYEKFGDIDARPAKVGEVIITIINGKVETKSKPAEEGDMVATGINGENYLIKAKKFPQLYKKIGDKYRPTGRVKAFMVSEKIGKFHFTAPWGEDMLAEPGDYIATSISDNYDDTKLYRIEHNVFRKTFKHLI